jgi:hypothetical protein
MEIITMSKLIQQTRLKPKGMYVYCTTRFEGLHKWEDAPSNVAYLRNLHRHMFYVKVMIKVTHNNRNVEFIGLKHNVDSIITGCGDTWHQGMSCEMMAESLASQIHIMSSLKVHSVEVSEDGENGAVVVYE